MDMDAELTIKLTKQRLDLLLTVVMQASGRVPYGVVFEIVDQISRQVQNQQGADSPAPDGGA